MTDQNHIDDRSFLIIATNFICPIFEIAGLKFAIEVTCSIFDRIISQRQYKRKIKRDHRDIPSYVTLDRRRNSNGSCTGSKRATAAARALPPAKVPRSNGIGSKGGGEDDRSLNVVSKTTYKLRAFEDGEEEDAELV